VTIASRNERLPRFSVYQLGRGRDPVIVVAKIVSAVALNIQHVLLGGRLLNRPVATTLLRVAPSLQDAAVLCTVAAHMERPG
jgi:hypothetical protein